MKITSIVIIAVFTVGQFMAGCAREVNQLPQQGDVGIEMKGFDGEWSEVVLVHGYPNNHGPAEMIKKMADDTSGRPEGSFRLKEH